MTSEGTQHPGQEPEEAGVGGPAPYGSSQPQRGAAADPGDPGAGHQPEQWAPAGGGWRTGFGDQPGGAGYPAPPPYPAPPGIAAPSIPPAEPWSPQQAWRTDPERPAPPAPAPQPPAVPPAAAGFGELPQRQPEPQQQPEPFRRPEAQQQPEQPEPPRFAPGPPAESPQPGGALPFSPSGPTPLPPQETRVPGASLAAALGGAPMPADPMQAPHVPQQQTPHPQQQTPHVPQQRGPYPDPALADAHPGFPGSGQPGGEASGPEPAADRPATAAGPSTPAGPGVEQHRPAAATAGSTGRAVTATAAVPSTSRVAPPTDPAALPAGRAPAQPRVYGRPVSGAAPAAEQHPEPFGQRPQPPGQNGVPFAPPGSPVPMPEHNPGLPPLTPRRPGQVAPPFGARPTPDGAPDGAGPDAAALALPHLSAGAHIQPSSPPESAQGYRPAGAPPYGDLVDSGNPGAGHWNHPDLAGRQHPAGPGQPGATPAVDGAPPAGQWGPPDPEQNRFDAFRPDAAEPAADEAKPEPAPQVRNGRVLVAVFVAAVLLVGIPMSLVWLITRPGEQPFNPAVGDCVKQSGNTAAPADCAEPGAYQIIAKVDQLDQCDDPTAPHIEIPADSGRAQVLCLQSAATEPDPQSSADTGEEATE
ncbi:hypothetical protein O7621_04890 [Solwaraspora sp. WMMD937]|uniref:LppU/SCO3897 family protein n=1 Tax=Solwaraspora sp. WMMD937 TaxID=3016090 RepID=UPI00249AF038|nr:hypothetical protein [Solwaraspora sp. WMMD937]WFE22685.1 hypothetical protein O7621_04890 [Solwaraspora sp. WMMD937]